MADVFLSFSDQDRDAAMTLRNLLRQQGLSVFLAHPDLFTRDEILDALRSATCVVVVSTLASIREQPFIDEMSSLGVPIMVCAEGVAEADLPQSLLGAEIVRPEAVLERIGFIKQRAASAIATSAAPRKRTFHIGGSGSSELSDEQGVPEQIKPANAPEQTAVDKRQAERDETYRMRMEQDDVPSTIGSAPHPVGASQDVLNDRLTIDTLQSLTQRLSDVVGGPEDKATKASPKKVNFFSRLVGRRSSAVETSTDLVDCSVFAPPAAPPGSTIMVQVFLHLAEHAARAQSMAKMMDQSTSIRGVRTLNVEVARGATVGVSLSVAGLEVDEPQQSAVWRGEAVFCQFLLTLPESCHGRAFHPTVRLSVAGGLVGCIKFQLVADPQVASPRSEPRGESARRYEHAFLSYASADRKEVLKRAQVLQAAGINFFQDVLKLDPGVRWEREIYKNIDKCDLFLLFWSQAAKNSQWVIKEAEYALRRRGEGDMPDIVPVILQSPPPLPPPAGLTAIHIDDRIHYMIAAS